MALQDRLDAFKADFESGKPPYSVPRSVIETMHRATAELIAPGQAERAGKAGDIATEFTLGDPEGQPVSSAVLLSRGRSNERPSNNSFSPNAFLRSRAVTTSNCTLLRRVKSSIRCACSPL